MMRWVWSGKAKTDPSRPILCPDCGADRLELDAGYVVCGECGASRRLPSRKGVLEQYFDETITSPFLRKAMEEGDKVRGDSK